MQLSGIIYRLVILKVSFVTSILLILNNAIDFLMFLDLIAKQDTQITPELIQIFKDKKISEYSVRSPLTCVSPRSICRACYGWHLSYSKLVDLGEAVGILPDQVADKGEGELANFFGRPAYTMVLISKLIKRTDAAIIMAYGERLKNGNGFNIHVEELKRKDIETTNDLNKQVENFIKKNSTQYYWSYDRYKSVQK